MIDLLPGYFLGFLLGHTFVIICHVFLTVEKITGKLSTEIEAENGRHTQQVRWHQWEEKQS